MHTTHSNTQYKNESKHSEMGPVRQNPTQRTVSLFICVCIALCTTVAHNSVQNRPDSFPSYPPDNRPSWALNLLYGVLYSNACMKQRFMTSTTCENDWCKLALTLTRTSSMRDHLRSCVHADGGHFEHTHSDMNVHLYDTQNILWNCQCNLMHVTAIL